MGQLCPPPCLGAKQSESWESHQPSDVEMPDVGMGEDFKRRMCSGDDSVCHNSSEARILSFALKLHFSLAKAAGPV